MLRHLLVTAAVLCAPFVRAEAPIAVRGLTQQTFPATLSGAPYEGWGGNIYLYLDNGEELIGKFWGSDGNVSLNGSVGVGKGGFFVFAFNPLPGGGFRDTFTTDTTNCTFPMPMGRLGLAAYHGTTRIISGTGRFANAEGTFLLNGSWMGLPEGMPGGLLAICNCDVSGTLSKVLPAQ